MPRQESEYVPCVPGAEVVVHNNGAPGAAGFMDIILVDIIHDADYDVFADREDSRLAFLIPARMTSIGLLSSL
jgi:hypothetical protein